MYIGYLSEPEFEVLKQLSCVNHFSTKKLKISEAALTKVVAWRYICPDNSSASGLGGRGFKSRQIGL
jgi:hypothetical protein